MYNLEAVAGWERLSPQSQVETTNIVRSLEAQHIEFAEIQIDEQTCDVVFNMKTRADEIVGRMEAGLIDVESLPEPARAMIGNCLMSVHMTKQIQSIN